MFITVLYGDNEQALFNIHCKAISLLECIRSSCHCQNEVEIDLADETGQVKNLLQNGHRYASEILTERQEFVLVSVSRPPGSPQPVYTSLLNDESVISAKFLAKLGSKDGDKTSAHKAKEKKANRRSPALPSASASFLEVQHVPPQRSKTSMAASARTKQRKD
ncbi:uncharacterized protein CXorf65 homolog isoform X2 [Erpetoichthys calabaricus]|uniref:uncharacterized protein CXorf65 homolog isoform X2 n=1 Tax=Erpetoichthys calabaricus TaxID=27687 RepID=UPI0022349D84|nr:uncharacterized protein CXorf65 homolog isoform X2 [Erpetoichthys calabaricus]